MEVLLLRHECEIAEYLSNQNWLQSDEMGSVMIEPPSAIDLEIHLISIALNLSTEPYYLHDCVATRTAVGPNSFSSLITLATLQQSYSERAIAAVVVEATIRLDY